MPEKNISKTDAASADIDLDAMMDSMSLAEIRKLAKATLKVRYYDRIRNREYARGEGRQKRLTYNRNYYQTVVKPQMEARKQAKSADILQAMGGTSSADNTDNNM